MGAKFSLYRTKDGKTLALRQMTPPLDKRVLLLVESSAITGATSTIRARALARLHGLAPDFFADFLCVPPRKKSFSQENLLRAAIALGCDVGYLTGEQDVPRMQSEHQTDASPHSIRLSGKCVTGVWQSKEVLDHESLPMAPIYPDPRFPDLPSVAYAVMGVGMAAIGFDDYFFVVGSPYEKVAQIQPLRVGDVVVLRRERIATKEAEISLRIVTATSPGIVFEALSVNPEQRFPPISMLETPIGEEVTVLAVVWRAIKIFGAGVLLSHTIPF